MVDSKLEKDLIDVRAEIEDRIVKMKDMGGKDGFEFVLDTYALVNQYFSVLTIAERVGILNNEERKNFEDYRAQLIGLRGSIMKDLHVINPAKPEGRIY